MSKIFAKIFPLFDHLYIFQLLEYNLTDFFVWFLKYPSKRNLQKKNKLTFSNKVVILAVLSILLLFLASVATAEIFFDVALWPFFVFFYVIFSPIFIIASQILFYPLEVYSKYKVTNAAREKIKHLKNLSSIAIVGSFAKTSTKNILYTLIWKDFIAVKTPKSFNTEVSIARTILDDLKENSEVFLAEMDAYHPGEIKKLVNLVKPKFGVITAIAAQHLERFGTMERLAKTQFELAENLNDGILFINSQDSWSMKLQTDVKSTKIFYGIRKEDDFYASNIQPTSNGFKFKLNTKTSSVQVELPLFGAHHIINFLAASSIALTLGVSLETIQERAKLIQPTEHRLEIRKMGQITLIDNSYNTNPTVSKSSLKVLKEQKGSEKILITPGLVELGDEANKENEIFAKESSKVANQIIIVGRNAKKALLKGLNAGNFPKDKIHEVRSTGEAMSLLSKIAKPESVVLIENDLPDQYF
jgi:UDP-N-acetylmuramoyl-tripeptide--D-alanyl-D-alanine ligase